MIHRADPLDFSAAPVNFDNRKGGRGEVQRKLVSEDAAKQAKWPTECAVSQDRAISDELNNR